MRLTSVLAKTAALEEVLTHRKWQPESELRLILYFCNYVRASELPAVTQAT